VCRVAAIITTLTPKSAENRLFIICLPPVWLRGEIAQAPPSCKPLLMARMIHPARHWQDGYRRGSYDIRYRRRTQARYDPETPSLDLDVEVQQGVRLSIAFTQAAQGIVDRRRL
jgi:hypothetical protein